MNGTRLRRFRLGPLFAAAWCVLALPLPLSAQEAAEAAEANAASEAAANDEARSLYEAGAAAFSDGRFQDALTYWRNSYDLSGRAELLHNIGIAHDRLGQRDEAIARYGAFLAERPDAENRAYVERRIAQLEAQAAEAGSRRHGSRLNIGAIALTSLGGVMVMSGLGTGLAANGRFAELEAACPDMACDESERENAARVQRLARATDVLLIVGAGATLAGVLWWVLGRHDEPDVQIDVGLAGLSLRGRF